MYKARYNFDKEYIARDLVQMPICVSELCLVNSFCGQVKIATIVIYNSRDSLNTNF